MKHWTVKLMELRACPDAVAWAACDRGDWMLWLAGRVSGEPGSESRRLVARAAAAASWAASAAAARIKRLSECADLVRGFYPALAGAAGHRPALVVSGCWCGGANEP